MEKLFDTDIESTGLDEFVGTLIENVKYRIPITEVELASCYLDPGLCRKSYVINAMFTHGKTPVELIEVGIKFFSLIMSLHFFFIRGSCFDFLN